MDAERRLAVVDARDPEAMRAALDRFNATHPPAMLGVDLTPKPAPEIEAPPVGGVRLGVTVAGLVGIRMSEPRDEILLTPDQAHSLGRGLLKHAVKARKQKA